MTQRTPDEVKGYIRDDDLKDFADQLTDERSVQSMRGTGDELQVELVLPNPSWGLPGEIRDAMTAIEIVIGDFSHVSETRITVYFETR